MRWCWVVAWLLTGCVFEYHPYEIRLKPEEQNLNAKSITRIQSVAPTDTLYIALIADTQRFYDELELIVESANTRTYDFMLIAGDITEYGLEQEYRWIHKSLKKLKQPYVAAIGNHDFQGDGKHLFRQMFGPTESSFSHGRFNFVLHDTNSREHNFSGVVPNLPFLRNELSDSLTNIVVGHVSPFSSDFDPTLTAPYLQLFNQKQVLLAIYGHDHSFKLTMDEQDEVTYLVCPSPDQRFYLMLKVWATHYELEKIYY
jgi:3',5'-cyclic-AMP phosphodiesterase